MYCKVVVAFCLLAVTLQNAKALPIGCQSPINSVSNMYNQILPADAIPGAPVITEIIPSLQFGDISATGDLPVLGSIRVKGIFPVYGTVALDGDLPSTGTAVVNAGSGVKAQCI